jgi:hypothetical protein
MTTYYAGIGARATPADVLLTMTTFADNMEREGYILRSGGAEGADTAFENGVRDYARKDIYLPWKRFNNNPSPLHGVTNAALEMAAKYHPNWKCCSSAARAFHARNCYQMLGVDLKTPVEFVICWTPGGKVTGGTGQALRIAIDLDIPIHNLGDDDEA